jgi:hypothetical protein
LFQAKNKREQDNSVDKTEENSNADTSEDSWWAQKKRNWDRYVYTITPVCSVKLKVNILHHHRHFFIASPPPYFSLFAVYTGAIVVCDGPVAKLSNLRLFIG